MLVPGAPLDCLDESLPIVTRTRRRAVAADAPSAMADIEPSAEAVIQSSAMADLEPSAMGDVEPSAEAVI